MRYTKLRFVQIFFLCFHFYHDCPYLLQQNHKKWNRTKNFFLPFGNFFSVCRTIVGLLSIVCRHTYTKNTVTIIFQICLWHFYKQTRHRMGNIIFFSNFLQFSLEHCLHFHALCILTYYK